MGGSWPGAGDVCLGCEGKGVMVEYTIASIPTRYKGRQYRSRLEAKWAAFFDLCGWNAEYEPYDLGEWSPDFLLHGADKAILVEVKPIRAFDYETADKMANAATLARFNGELLLVGSTPFELTNGDNSEWLGWLCDSVDPWHSSSLPGEIAADDAYFVEDFYPCWMVTGDHGGVDFCHGLNAYAGRMTGCWDGDHCCHGCEDDLRAIWARASNAVQWKRA